MIKNSNLFDSLNKEQLEAVKTINGPLLVVAGPGTGKTELLAMRVANILISTDTDASNILCLTFTNKAAVNMKKRIISIAGKAGSKTVVKTFHSLASEIINAYPDDFFNGAKLSVAPESVQLEIIQDILDSLPPDNPLALKFAGQYTLINDVLKSINLAKDSGLTPKKLKILLEANLSYIDEIEQDLVDILEPRLSFNSLPELKTKINSLPLQKFDELTKPIISLSTAIEESFDIAYAKDIETNKTKNISKWKTHWVQSEDGQKGMHREKNKNSWWLELSEVYRIYREIMHSRGYFDYSDLLVEVLSQLENSKSMLSDLRERFEYVLIDEFQDTNDAQLRLAHLIADSPVSEGNPNIMAVGDDDQSIFKFTGASINNMLDFRRSYPTGKVIILKENYRSNQQVLDVAKIIIEQASYRLVDSDKTLNKTLIASKNKNEGSIKFRSFSNREIQYSILAREIKNSRSKGKTTAVIARSHDSLIKFASILNQLKVPINYEKQSNVLEHSLVNSVYDIAKLLSALEKGDQNTVNSLIHLIIRHPMWNIDPKVLWDQARENFFNPDWLKSASQSKDKDVIKFYNFIKSCSKAIYNQPLALCIEYLIGLRPVLGMVSPVREFYLSDKEKSQQYFEALSAIQLIRSLANEFSQTKNPSLDDFIKLIEVNRENNKVIADESPFISGEDPIFLLTVHKAKGLEFDSVYIIDTVESIWQPSRGSRKPPSNLPLQPPGDDINDYIRLMYVAATRAKTNLSISGYELDHAGKDVAYSHIIEGEFEVTKEDERKKVAIVDALEESISWPRLSTGNEKEILKSRLSNYQLSVTHLLNFLNIERGGPINFYERNILNLPEIKKPHMSYGTAMHAALEYANHEFKNNNVITKKIIKVFEDNLKKEQLPQNEFRKYLHNGTKCLHRIFDEFNMTFSESSLPEQDIADVKLNNAIIRGKLDRLDIEDKKLIVTDYKTGSPFSSFSSMSKSLQEKIWRNKIQLVFYSILIKNSPRFTRYSEYILSGQMCYVESEAEKTFILDYTPTDDDIKQLQELIEIVYKKIINLDFPDVNKYSKDFSGTQNFIDDIMSRKI